MENEESRPNIEDYELWIEKIAKSLRLQVLEEKGFLHSLKEKIGAYNLSSYLYLWIFLGIQTFIITPITNSGWPSLRMVGFFSLAWVGLTFAVRASEDMREKYLTTNNKLGLKLKKPDFSGIMDTLFPRLKPVVLAVVLIIITTWFLGAMKIITTPLVGSIEEAWEFNVPTIFSYSVWILAILPVLSDFGSASVGIPFYLPWKIKKYKPSLDFSDPLRKAG